MSVCSLYFFLNDPATTEFYPLSLHAALPISAAPGARDAGGPVGVPVAGGWRGRRLRPAGAPVVRAGGQARCTSTDCRTTPSTGGPPRPVRTLAMRSTTSPPAWAARSPKIVVLAVSQVA